MTKNEEPEVKETTAPKTKKETVKIEEPSFSKAQFMMRYPKCRDVLNTLLKNGTKYTKSDVKQRVRKFRATEI